MSDEPAIHARKRNKFEKERDLADIATLCLKEKTQYEIVAWIKANRPYSITQAQVSYDIKKIRQIWKDRAFAGLDEQRRIEIGKIESVERDAWNAWEQSKTDEVRKTEREVETDEGPELTKTVSAVGQSGDPRFLDIVLRCIDRRCALLGLDAPQQANVRVQHSTIIAGLPDEHIDSILSEHYQPRLTNGETGNGHSNGQVEPD